MPNQRHPQAAVIRCTQLRVTVKKSAGSYYRRLWCHLCQIVQASPVAIGFCRQIDAVPPNRPLAHLLRIDVFSPVSQQISFPGQTLSAQSSHPQAEQGSAIGDPPN